MPLKHPQPNRIGLSQQDLCAISQAISRDFSPRFFSSRSGRGGRNKFAPQELREISRQISRDFAPRADIDKSKVVLLTVAPRRLHVYWQIANQSIPEIAEAISTNTTTVQRGDAPQLTLRISPTGQSETCQSASSGSPVEASPLEQAWIDIAVDDWQGRQDVLLPAVTSKAGSELKSYQAVLGHKRGGTEFTPLVYSNFTDTPGAERPKEPSLLPTGPVRFIMPASNASSPGIHTASGQGKQLSR